MPYTHFGKPADVWKHLALCEAMVNEHPDVYVETNSAYACYELTRTPGQQYGIYRFVDIAPEYEILSASTYYELENKAVNGTKYIGSPGLAMSILGDTADRYIFYDIEIGALNNIIEFAKDKKLASKVDTINQDSIIGVTNLLPHLPKSTLIHIDPYYIDRPSSNGYDYLDIFIQAISKGLKCILWYGFNTLEEKKYINDFIRKKFTNKKTENLSCVELIMEIIEQDTIPCNPGILGNGMLTGNLSKRSALQIREYGSALTELYKGSTYNGFKGDLYREIITI